MRTRQIQSGVQYKTQRRNEKLSDKAKDTSHNLHKAHRSIRVDMVSEDKGRPMDMAIRILEENVFHHQNITPPRSPRRPATERIPVTIVPVTKTLRERAPLLFHIEEKEKHYHGTIERRTGDRISGLADFGM
jgi:hypothetical protein